MVRVVAVVTPIAAHHPLPVRRIRAGQGGRKIITRFPSLKMGQVVWGESTLERDYHRLLEFDSGVRSFREQPFRIEYVLDGETRSYTPDVLVERTDGRRQVFEVKEEEEARRPENELLYSLIRPICEREGYRFHLALDADIRRQPRLRNITLLLRYQRTPFGVRERLVCREFFRGGRLSASLRELTNFCAGWGVGSNIVHAMICRGVLAVNLHHLLTPESPVRLAGCVPL